MSTVVDIKSLEKCVSELIATYLSLGSLVRSSQRGSLLMGIRALMCRYLKSNTIVLSKDDEILLLEKITNIFDDVYSSGNGEPSSLFSRFWAHLNDILCPFFGRDVKEEETEFNIKQFMAILSKEKAKGISWNESPQHKLVKAGRKELLVRACIDGIVNNKDTEDYESKFNDEFPKQEPLSVYLLEFACLYDKLPVVLRLCDELSVKDKELTRFLPYAVMGNSISVFSYLIGRFDNLEHEDDHISSAIVMAVALNRVSFVDVFYYKFGVKSYLSVLSPSNEMEQLMAGPH